MGVTEGSSWQRSGRWLSPSIPFTPSFAPPRRCRQGISSARSDGYVWINAFAPSWCVSWVTLESCNAKLARSACDVVLSSLDGTRSKRVGVRWKHVGFTLRFTKAFPEKPVAPSSDARHPESPKTGARHHDEFRLPIYEARAPKPAATSPYFVGIESATHTDHIFTDQLPFANVHDPPYQTFHYWIGIRRPASGSLPGREEASSPLHSR